MHYSARQLAKILGVEPSTISRMIRRGELSAERNEKGQYRIDASEIARAFAERIVVDDAGNVAPRSSPQRDATAVPDVATVRVELLERLLADRDAQIADLRRRLDDESAERRQLSARLADRRPSAGWFRRLFHWR